ncbi:thiamine-monophosphate kinase [Novosphingobium endophyticum]|uniref:Thiamine-monophosphate kinase n=1 Tax=Novosphingobium endophyticum TaxID=1955250 RepID=A0A916TPL5_9SPHN|nr:thiamine-phosphate kinase [Novosphingobium endophyticum]GGB87700.1 thiamine-monophosphate kinase [Novosphingobium endophyticum]
MTSEFAFIEALRAIATNPAARGLADDAAVIEIGGETLVLTMDTIVETVHCLPGDPAADVAWKLVAVNVSDLAAKGAEPVGCLVSYALGDEEWDHGFLEGLQQAATHFAIPLLGGDTVRMPQGAPRSFSLTAIGRGPKGCAIPSRCGAKPGDRVWVSGTIGDAGLGLAILSGHRFAARSDPVTADWLVRRYRRPAPDVVLGIALAPHVTAMMDVSDGLLVDSRRMAEASGAGIVISVESVPLSDAHREVAGQDLDARLAAMTAGDDYCLLFTAPPQRTAQIRKAAAGLGCEVSAIGSVGGGAGLALVHNGEPIPLPGHLGYQH